MSAVARRPGWLAYLALMGLALALLAALWLAPGPLARWRHWQAPPPQAPNLDDVQAAAPHANPAARATYPEVLARPLFSPTRQPQAAASSPQAPAAAPASIDSVQLRGLIVGPTLSGVMLEEDGQTRFLRVGARVGDWTLVQLRRQAAVFERQGQRREFQLPTAQAEGAPGAGGAVGAAAPPGSPTQTRVPTSPEGAAAASGERVRQAQRPERAAATEGANADGPSPSAAPATPAAASTEGVPTPPSPAAPPARAKPASPSAPRGPSTLM